MQVTDHDNDYMCMIFIYEFSRFVTCDWFDIFKFSTLSTYFVAVLIWMVEVEVFIFNFIILMWFQIHIWFIQLRASLIAKGYILFHQHYFLRVALVCWFRFIPNIEKILYSLFALCMTFSKVFLIHLNESFMPKSLEKILTLMIQHRETWTWRRKKPIIRKKKVKERRKNIMKISSRILRAWVIV